MQQPLEAPLARRHLCLIVIAHGGKAQPPAPLAEALRPQSLDEVVGQKHLLGPGKPLRLAFESRKPHSMILWGPPGSGKTTLARLMARAFDAEFIALSAVFSGVKDIREAMETAEQELAQQDDFDELIVNDNLDDASDQLESIVRSSIGLGS